MVIWWCKTDVKDVCSTCFRNWQNFRKPSGFTITTTWWNIANWPPFFLWYFDNIDLKQEYKLFQNFNLSVPVFLTLKMEMLYVYFLWKEVLFLPVFKTIVEINIFFLIFPSYCMKPNYCFHEKLNTIKRKSHLLLDSIYTARTNI